MTFDKKHWELVAVFGLIIIFASLSIDMYLPAFPAITKDFYTKLDYTQYSLSAFFLGIAIGQLIYGPLTDRFGRKKPLLIAFIIFIASSFACALAPNVWVLIASRFAQALGCCSVMISPRAAVRDMFEKREVARFYSSQFLIIAVSPILAPLLGGYLSKAFGWRAIFELITVLGILGLIMVSLKFPETHKLENRHKRTSFPHVMKMYSELLKDKTFIGYVLAGSFAQAGLYTYLTGSPFVLIEFYHVKPENYGYYFGANAAGLIAVSQLNRYLLKHFDLDKILQANLSLIALAGIGGVLVAIFHGGLMGMVCVLFCYIALLGAVTSNTTAGALDKHGSKAGSASALLGGIQFAFAFSASAILGILHDGTILPMTGIMAFCAVMAVGLYFKMVKGKVAAKPEKEIYARNRQATNDQTIE